MNPVLLPAVTLIASTFPALANIVDFQKPNETSRLIARYGANTEVGFTVVDINGKPVEHVSVCGVKTDASGKAVYRGIVFNGQLQVSVSSPNIYSPVVPPVVFTSLSNDKKRFMPTNVPPIVVRRKSKPHPMKTGSINFGSHIPDRPLLIKHETEWFNAELGVFPGVSDNRGYCNLRAGYCVLEPKTPEDGFQEIESFPDSLGTPLAAPRDGYATGPFELMFRENNRDYQSPRGRIVAFRHKTPGGFVYGIVNAFRIGINGLEYRVNSVVDELSLEPEDRR
jgi:hypothetical protein